MCYIQSEGAVFLAFTLANAVDRERTMSAKAYRRKTKGKRTGDVLSVRQAIRRVYPALERELFKNIVDGVSYDRMCVPLNRPDFYGYRRKVLDILAREEES